MPPLHAVGVTLNVDRLVHVAQAGSRWRPPTNVAPGEGGRRGSGGGGAA